MINKTFLFLLIFFISNSLYSQHEFDKIKTAYVNNTLSYSQYLEYSALNIFEPESVPVNYRLGGDIKPLKSGTFLVQEIKNNWQKLSPNVQKTLEKYLTRYDLEYNILSLSGRFRLHYDVTGHNAVDVTDNNKNNIPDYVDSAGLYFDYAHHLLMDSLGYNPPAPDSSGNGKEFDIYFVHISGAYGVTWLEETVPGRSNAYSCYMTLENDFKGFQTPPLKSLRVTSAHEYYHAVQVNYAYRDEDVFFMEMCSTWMEDFAHDDVNDYLLYLDSFFNQANYPFSYANGSYEYGSALWNHMIVQKYEPDLVRKIWEKMPQKNAITSIRDVLPEYNTSFNKELVSFGLWNYFSNERADVYNFYPEGDLYPGLRFSQEHTINGHDLSIEGEMNKLSSIYYNIIDVTNNLTIGIIITNFETPSKTIHGDYDLSDKANFSVDIISLSSDEPPGDADFFLKNNLMKLTNRHGIRLNIEHQEEWFANAVVTQGNGEYETIQFYPMYSVNGGDDKNFIENIYPSPMVIGKNEPLLIRYVVSDEKAGELDIFSSDGRLMKKFEFASPKYNYHITQWDGRNEEGTLVSSGIYILVLRVGNAVDTQKFAVIIN